jgi:hypothetical protein
MGDSFASATPAVTARKPRPMFVPMAPSPPNAANSLIQTPAVELGAYLSPDDRWIAYLSDETGKQELYVQAFGPGAKPGVASSSGKWMVSKNGSAGMARWRNDGKELIYLSTDGSVMSVDVTADSAFHASLPKVLFQMPRSVLAMTNTPERFPCNLRLQRFDYRLARNIRPGVHHGSELAVRAPNTDRPIAE